jgi:ribosome-associated protein
MNSKSLLKECIIKFVRSGGAGGQNVNKVASQAELYFDVKNSVVLNDVEKQIVLEKLANKISSEGILQLQNQTERSQLSNKLKVQQKFLKAIEKALTPKKKRIKTKVPKAVKEKILKTKKVNSEKKQNRRKINTKDI